MTALGVMRMALEALLKCREGFEYTRQYVGEDVLPPIDGWSWFEGDKAAKEAITALRSAIAEMERAEPVAWKYPHGTLDVVGDRTVAIPLYTHPAAPSQEQK